MKADIQPQYNPVVFVDGDHEIITRSTITSKVTREIDGVTHHRCVHPAESGSAGGLVAWLHQLRARRGFVGAAATVVEEELLMRMLRRRIVEVARRMRADLIHVHTPYRCACPALAAGKHLRLPVVYEVRGTWEDTAVSDGLLREGGLNLMEMEIPALLDRACAHEWSFACQRIASRS